MTPVTELPPVDKSIRIAVVGCFSAGKTEFIRSICAVSAYEVRSYYDEVREPLFESTGKPYPALDIGIVFDDGWSLCLFGIPGAIRTDISWFTEKPLLVSNVVGLILMVPTYKQYWPGIVRETLEILNQIKMSGIPYLVVANYQDLPEVVSPEEVQSALNLFPDVKVFPCIATQRETTVPILTALFNSLSDLPGKNELMRKIQTSLA